MPSRPFLKRGAGTTDKFNIKYPVRERSKANQYMPNPDDRLVNYSDDEMHYASAPVRQQSNSDNKHQTAIMSPLVFDVQRPTSSEGAVRTDSGRGSREAQTPETNARLTDRQLSPEYIAPDSMATHRTNDSGFTASTPEAAHETNAFRDIQIDPDQTEDKDQTLKENDPIRNRIISVGAHPISITEESSSPTLPPTSELSSTGTRRSDRVVATRASARRIAEDVKIRYTPSPIQASEPGTLDLVSEISTLTTSSNRHPRTQLNVRQSVSRMHETVTPQPIVEDSDFFRKNIATTAFDKAYRPLADLYAHDGKSLTSSVAAAIPSQATRRPQPFMEKSAQANSFDFPQIRHKPVRDIERVRFEGNAENVMSRTDRIANLNREIVAETRRPLQSQRRTELSHLESQLACQLRDAILNLDFAEGELRHKIREMQDEVELVKAQAAEENKNREQLLENERAQLEKDKANFERTLKAHKKGTEEKEKVMNKQVNETKELASKHYSTVLDLRNKLKRMEAESETLKKEKENERIRAERLQGMVDQLRDELKNVRGELAARKARNDRDVVANQKGQATQNLQKRKTFNTNAATSGSRSLPLETLESPVNLPVRNGSTKSVHWADTSFGSSKSLGANSSPRNQLYLMSSEITESGTMTRIYVSGEWTKSCNCAFYEYKNGDVFWRRPELQVYYFKETGTTEFRFYNGPVVIFYASRQLDIIRENGEATSVRPNGVRFEKKHDNLGRKYTEKFSPDQDPLREGRSPNVPIMLHLDEIPAGIWLQGGFFKISTEKLQISISLAEDHGRIKHVCTVGSEKLKEECACWGSPIRRQNRAQLHSF